MAVSEALQPRPHLTFSSLFRYKSVALMSPRHRLAAKGWLDTMERRTAELTVAILQLVASARGIAALPSWTVGNYIERGYLVSRRIGLTGLRCELHAATRRFTADGKYIKEFIALMRAQSLAGLTGLNNDD